jgi:hypothetical protein
MQILAHRYDRWDWLLSFSRYLGPDAGCPLWIRVHDEDAPLPPLVFDREVDCKGALPRSAFYGGTSNGRHATHDRPIQIGWQLFERRTLSGGRCALDVGRCAFDAGPRVLRARRRTAGGARSTLGGPRSTLGRGCCAFDVGRRAVGIGRCVFDVGWRAAYVRRWALGAGRWTLGARRWALDGGGLASNAGRRGACV